MNINPPPSLQAAFELLLLFARTRLKPIHVDRIHQIVQEDVPWGELIKLAEQHGILPLLQKNLVDVCSGSVPEELSRYLNLKSFTASMHNLFLVQELGRLVSLFEHQGIPALALKGPALAQMAYGDINLRSYIDLDVLIRKENFNAVQRMLVDDGYTPQKKVHGLQGVRKKLYIWQAAQYPFRRGDNIFQLDLHTRIMPPLYSYRIQFNTLLERSQFVSLGDKKVYSFEPEDMLQILCYHGAKNRWGSLKYMCDVAELVQSSNALDWDRIIKRASYTRSQRVLFLGLSMAHLVLGAELPEEVLRAIKKEEVVHQIATRLQERFHEQIHNESMGFAERFRFNLTIQDTLFNKLRYGYFAFIRRLFDTQPGRFDSLDNEQDFDEYISQERPA